MRRDETAFLVSSRREMKRDYDFKAFEMGNYGVEMADLS